MSDPYSFTAPTNEKRRWLFLDEFIPNTAVVNYVIREVYATVQATGDYCAVLNTSEFTKERFADYLKKNSDWDVIVWASVAGFKFFEALKTVAAKKVCLWFDEPITRCMAFGLDKYMADDSIEHFVWDKYWIGICNHKWIREFHHVALSAGWEFFPADTRLSDDIVFIGSLQSPAKIASAIDRLPRIMQKAVLHIANRLTTPRDAILMTQDALDMMSQGDSRLFRLVCSSDVKSLSEYLQIVWSLAKNAVRITAVRRALRVAPVRFYTEPVANAHANGNEIEGLIGEYGKRLHVYEVSHADTGLLAECYHYGAVHVGATDPQSVLGGLPLRVFQTAASGRLLVTDWLQELDESFDGKKEMLYYTNLDQMEAQLAWGVAHPAACDEMGREARKRFEKDHTWDKRLTTIKNGIGIY